MSGVLLPCFLVITACCSASSIGIHLEDENVEPGTNDDPLTRLRRSLSKFESLKKREREQNLIELGAISTEIATDTPSIVRSHVGDTVFLPCRVTHLGTQSVTWVRDGFVLSIDTFLTVPNSRLTVTQDNETWRLTVKSAQESDAGVYRCSVTSTPTVQREVTLHVLPRGASILHDHSDSLLETDLMELRANVSVLWEELLALRQEVAHHHQGGHEAPPHDWVEAAVDQRPSYHHRAHHNSDSYSEDSDSRVRRGQENKGQEYHYFQHGPQRNTIGHSVNRHEPVSNTIGHSVNRHEPVSNTIEHSVNRHEPVSNTIGHSVNRHKPVSNTIGHSVNRHEPVSNRQWDNPVNDDNEHRNGGDSIAYTNIHFNADPRHYHTSSRRVTNPHYNHHHRQSRSQRHLATAECDVRLNQPELPSVHLTGRVTISQRKDQTGPVSFKVDLQEFDHKDGPHLYVLHVHESSITDDNCTSAGGYYDPHHGRTAASVSAASSVSSIGVLTSSPDGDLTGRILKASEFKLTGRQGILGRSIVVHGVAADGGEGERLACCTVRGSMQGRRRRGQRRVNGGGSNSGVRNWSGGR